MSDVGIVLRLTGLALALNMVRYAIGGPIESIFILEPMHAMFPRFADTFDSDFTRQDYSISLGYNFALWFVAVVQFHLLRPALKGSIVLRSLKSFSLSGFAFVALAAVFMNHFTDALKEFFLWSMIDAAILFPLVGFSNGILYPLFFREIRNHTR